MIRGRHRGLPVAIDRAVMFPKEYRDGVSILSEKDLPLDEDSDSDPGDDLEEDILQLSRQEQGLQTVEEVATRPASRASDVDNLQQTEKAFQMHEPLDFDDTASTKEISDRILDLKLGEQNARSPTSTPHDDAIRHWAQHTSGFEVENPNPEGKPQYYENDRHHA